MDSRGHSPMEWHWMQARPGYMSEDSPPPGQNAPLVHTALTVPPSPVAELPPSHEPPPGAMGVPPLTQVWKVVIDAAGTPPPGGMVPACMRARARCAMLWPGYCADTA